MMRCFPSCLAVGLLGLCLSSQAFGYCRTTTCARDDAPEECVPGTVVDNCQMVGLPLFWPNPCVSFSVQQDGSALRHISASEMQTLVARAFDTWLAVDCGGGRTPGIAVQTYPQVTCNEITYNTDGPNQNVWFFRDTDWPYTGDGDRTIAITMVTFNWKTGEIMDVDVELNSYARDFSTQTGQGDEDLLSVIQHESGHFLGLAHSSVAAATMYRFYSTGTTMRTLDGDDAKGICTVYPPAALEENCDAEPRHGFTTECSDPPEKGCCSVAAGKGPRRGGLVAVLLPAAVLIVMRRFGRGRRRSPAS
jgi:hypothetical protein